jgi:hypothetical protein
VDEGERHGLGAIFGDAVVVELLRVGRGPLLSGERRDHGLRVERHRSGNAGRMPPPKREPRPVRSRRRGVLGFAPWLPPHPDSRPAHPFLRRTL